ncbi:alkaline phosphatase PhoX [Streptomyces sp. NPDC049627]|uniref:alkaline phosphatase PhoX n=1 Tax=Streptomyces sp. NPDC049627 TaxID=3365595 RepID=UPI0037ADDBCF
MAISPGRSTRAAATAPCTPRNCDGWTEQGLLGSSTARSYPLAVLPGERGRRSQPAGLSGTAAQGLTVLEVRESGGVWKAVDSAYNRRITGDSPVRFSGPVAVDGRSRGVLACGGHGITPWGTYLAAEENFNAAFGTDEPDPAIRSRRSRGESGRVRLGRGAGPR